MVRDAVSSKRVSSDYSLFFANLQRNIISRRYSGTIPSIKPGDYETLGPDFPDVRQQSINKAVSGPYQRSKLGLTGAAALTIARLQETPKNQEFCSAVTGWGGGASQNRRERGARNPTLSVIDKIAKALGTTALALLE